MLAIDCGTQSVRALLFDLRGNLLAKSRVAVTYESSVPGWVELAPEKFWEALCQACQELWQMEGVRKEAIAGVAITSQGSTPINLDARGQPLRPAISWQDQRRAAGVKPVKGLWGLAFALAGVSETISYLQAEAEGNWIRINQPEIWDKTAKFLLLSGYLVYRMTGAYRDSIGSQAAYIPFDYKKQAWAADWDWKWQAVPMDRSVLPELVPTAGRLGEVGAEAAAMTGIPAGLALIAAASDKACEALGAGCLEPEVACVSFGTQATINTTHRRYIEVLPMIPPLPAALPGHYNLGVQIFRGYWMVSWFKREFAQNEQRLAVERGVEVESLFDALVDEAPPGAQGLMLQPFWSPGLKLPGPEAKGAIIGFGDVHTRAHLYRSILEGLAYALRDGAERTRQRSGVAIREIRVAGGGSQSKAAMQISADIFGLPTANPHVYEASGLGAAIDLAVGLGLQPNFARAVADMTRQSRQFEPNPTHQKVYTELFERVYKKMYGRLKPLYEEIREITGYPSRD